MPEREGPSSYRCSVCGVNYPPEDDYVKCPRCDTETSAMAYAPPMDEDDARSILRHAQFEDYLEAEGRL